MNKSEKVKTWRRKTKSKMVASMGGECQCCGYSRCESSLCFHHINPEEKSLSFSKAMANPKSWKILSEELKKCILVCNNCHGEIHEGILKIPKDYQKFDESLIEHKKSPVTCCPICNGVKKNYNKTCSRKCSAKMSGKFDWSKISLKDMISKEMNYSQIGREIGLSGVSVKKRALKEGLITE